MVLQKYDLFERKLSPPAKSRIGRVALPLEGPHCGRSMASVILSILPVNLNGTW